MKLFTILLILIFIFSFEGCNGNKASTEEKIAGTFYSLQEAFDQGLISHDDLEKIASRNALRQGALNADIELAIKETHAAYLRNRSPFSNAIADDVLIIDYAGTFNGYVAVMIADLYTDYPAVMREVYIDNVLIQYSDGNSIVIWRQL